MAYCVVRTDRMSGVKQFVDTISVRVYGPAGGDDEANKVAIENGHIVAVEGFEDGQREIRVARPAAADSDLAVCALVATPELVYDERLKGLGDFINKAGDAARAYILRNRDEFSVTKEAFVNEGVPAVGDTVTLGANGKLVANGEGTALGICREIEVAGMHTFYLVEIRDAEHDTLAE